MNSVGKVHLAKYLKNYGNYTKSELKKLIEEKRVLVNGVLKPLSYIVKENDEILVDGQKSPKSLMFIIFIINLLELFVLIIFKLKIILLRI